MPYATQADVQMMIGGVDRLNQLFDFDGDNNPVKIAANVAAMQARADGWINEYLCKRFATPIANPTPELVGLAADECIYRARAARGMLALDQLDDERHKERQRYLEDLATGKMALSEPNPPKSSEVKTAMVPLGGDITRDGLKGMW